MANNLKQGMYKLRNPAKYIGDPSKIRYMSSYELETFNFLDGNPNVIKWASEEIPIKYIKPTDKRWHTYWPDLYVEYQNKHGEIKRELIEIKPLSQTKAPRKNHKHVLYEQLQWAVNAAKWEYAIAWCKSHNITFKVITETSIFK